MKNPIFSGAATKFYIVLEVTNLSKKKFSLMSSDHYPSQGFTINPGMVAKIKKAVSRPSAVIFNARDDSDAHEALRLNGLDNISVTPSKSPLQSVKVTITRKGQFKSFSECVFVCIPTIRTVSLYMFLVYLIYYDNDAGCGFSTFPG